MPNSGLLCFAMTFIIITAAIAFRWGSIVRLCPVMLGYS